MSPDQPILVIFGGPNGSGKSSFLKGYLSLIPDYYINADDMTMSRIPPEGLASVSSEKLRAINLEAARESDRLRAEAISEKRSFTTESVMSTDKGIRIMQAAKDNGYHVHLVYVLTDEPGINVRRIETRIAKGGHPVPPDKTISRYDRCLQLLPKEVQIADVAEIYNNSSTRPILIMEKTFDKDIKLYPQNPPSEWELSKLTALKSKVLQLDE